MISYSKKFPFLTLIIFLINILVFVLTVLYPELTFRLSFIPIEIPTPTGLITIFTSMFTHSDIIHLIGNIVFLLPFGIYVERRVSRSKFLLIYFGSGLVATGFSLLIILALSISNPIALIIPSLGSSGAIFGLIGVVLFELMTAEASLKKILKNIYGFDVKYDKMKKIFLSFASLYLAYFVISIRFLEFSLSDFAHIGGFLFGYYYIKREIMKNWKQYVENKLKEFKIPISESKRK